MNQTPATNDVQLTKDGYDQILAELKTLKDEKLPKAIARVATARSFGDLSENAEYQASRDDLAFVEGKVSELEMIVAKAKVVETSNGKKKSANKIVDLGSIVTVKSGRSTHKYHIVGEWEANPSEEKISHQSPLGKALIGKGKGEAIEVEVPAGKLKYVIMQID
ncbi:MAG TPA: transcription elongation factor GreA [Candidatus Saccharimonadia bacterium]|nr:transcription elongation factor GreA [Candidatus Saccharimonadia bacterium]